MYLRAGLAAGVEKTQTPANFEDHRSPQVRDWQLTKIAALNFLTTPWVGEAMLAQTNGCLPAQDGLRSSQAIIAMSISLEDVLERKAEATWKEPIGLRYLLSPSFSISLVQCKQHPGYISDSITIMQPWWTFVPRQDGRSVQCQPTARRPSQTYLSDGDVLMQDSRF